MSIKQALIKSFLGVGAMKLLSLPIGLVTSIILARVLGPEGFGQYAFIMALIPLIALPVRGGLPELLTREVASFAHASEWSLYKGALRASHGWVLIASGVILSAYCVLSLGSALVPNEGKWALLSVAILMVPLMGLSAARAGTIKGLGMPAIAEMPEQFLKPTFMLLLISVTASFQVLDARVAIWVQVVGAALSFLVASWMFYRVQPKVASKCPPEYQIQRWKSALLPFTLLAMVSAFNTQIGIIILGFLGSDQQVAALRIAERGGQFVVLSLTVVNMVIGPYIVRAHRDGNKELLEAMARKSARGSFLLSLPIVLILIFAGGPLIRLTFGIEYAEISYLPVAIVAVGQLFNVFFGSVGLLLAMSGNEKDTLKGQLLAVAVNLILCGLLVPLYGAVGAATAVAISILTWNATLFFMVKRRLKISCSII